MLRSNNRCKRRKPGRTLRSGVARPNVALRPDEIERIVAQLGREPSDVELYAFDAQWSEHCSYKSSRRFLSRLPSTGPDVVVGPGEDAGIVRLGEHAGTSYAIVVAHESHNHPSQVVPFEGAATGIGGVVRDVLCMGAHVIGVGDPLRFGRTEDRDAHQRYVARSVVDGIGAYGNAIGVPNIAGDVYFEEGFDDNCLVNVVALGVLKEADIVHSAAPRGADGWDLVLVGKATDESGFGGASFSSVTLDEDDEEANKGAVQVPDPFLKNVLMRATYRVFELLRERGIVAACKDLGAGGLMGCSAELASAGGYGAEIDLDRVNVAVDGLPPYVIAIGEAQERLLWALPHAATAEVLRIYNEEFSLPQLSHNARASIVGRITAEKRYVLQHGGVAVMDVDIDMLTGKIADDLPYVECIRHQPAGAELPAVDVERVFAKILAHRDVCSREPLYRRYDGVVRGTTVLPRGAADAGVLAPVPGSRLGVALAVAGNPRYGAMDAGYAAESAVLEATRRVIAVGARPVALTDCLNFGNPRDPEQYGTLASAVDGLARAARELGLPFVSGNVSLYNESASGSAVPASAIVSCIGTIEDVGTTVLPGLKRPGSALLWVGSRELAAGGSVLADVLGITSNLPEISYDAERSAITIVRSAMSSGVLLSCRAIGDGGMLTALARLAFDARSAGRELGAELDFGNPFCETGGFLCEVSDDSALNLSGILKVGETIARPQLVVNGTPFDVDELYRTWSHPLEELYR
jgi:phosphoribosylformylglycinamidine synthase subunit PurL